MVEIQTREVVVTQTVDGTFYQGKSEDVAEEYAVRHAVPLSSARLITGAQPVSVVPAEIRVNKTSN